MVIGLRIRVRYLWDTEKKLDWTYAYTSIDLNVLRGEKRLKGILKYLNAYGQELKIRSKVKLNG